MGPSEPVAPPSVAEHTLRVGEQTLRAHTISMVDSIYVWVGDDSGKMDTLALAISTPFSPHPSAREVLGGGSDRAGENIAARLSKKMGKPVLLSWNVDDPDPTFALDVEKAVVLALVPSTR